MLKPEMPSGESAETTRETATAVSAALGGAGNPSGKSRHLPVHPLLDGRPGGIAAVEPVELGAREPVRQDRKSTRLNSSHSSISYAVFCLKKKKKKNKLLILIKKKIKKLTT